MEIPNDIEGLQQLVIQLLERVEKLESENVQLTAEKAQLKLENVQLKAENIELREKLNLKSHNSGKPPSDRKSTRLNSSHVVTSRMPSSA